MRAAVVGMMLVALLAFASDRSFGQPNPGQQQQPRFGFGNLLGDPQETAGPAQAVVRPAQAVVPATNRLDVPASEELEDAKKQIHQAFGITEANKNDPKEKKIELAERLNTAADKTKEKDDPASKYALLEESQEWFSQAGDVDNAVRLLNAQGWLFKINIPEAKLKLIKEFPKPTGATAKKKLVELALKMADEALESDQVEIAENAIDLANTENAIELAQKLAGPGLLKTCAQEKARVKERRGACDECQMALAVLAKNPANKPANSVVGKYYSIDKHDWEKGLPYLIQGPQDSLQDYAMREQTLRQNKTKVSAANIIDQMFDLAGDWWTLSEDPKEKDEKLATGIKTHASCLYAELLPNLKHPVKTVLAQRRAAGGINKCPLPPKPKRIENSIGMEFVEIPTKPLFLLGKYEVTQSQFKKVMGVEPWVNQGGVQSGVQKEDTNAASYVDWDAAILFCKNLTESEREKGTLPKNEEYRLPTPEEWEYACRAGTETAFSFGDDEKQLGDFGWFDGNTKNVGQGFAQKVGMKKPNPWELHDMHGNVFEWCGSQAVPDPEVCGGSWSGNEGFCKLPNFSVRGRDRPASDVGFRVARSPEVSRENPTLAPRAELETFTHPIIGMEFVGIPKGKFRMGEDRGVVGVILTKPFWLGKYEVTQSQFKKVMATEPWVNAVDVQIDGDNAAPYVDWNDATAFCQRLTNTDHKNGKLPASESYHLPTEAQWEYACRAGTQTKFSFENAAEQFGDYGWFNGNTKNVGDRFSHKVGLKKPNPWGLYDMHGNVWESCSDWYGRGLSGGPDPVGPGNGPDRVFRGGSWWSFPDYCRSALRGHDAPSVRNSYLGFRVARSQSAQ